MALAEICNGRNLILSSEANHLILHRSPLEAKVLCSLLGIPEQHQEAVIGANCEYVINHASKHITVIM